MQAIAIGDVAIVGVPAEYFTIFGVDIKKRSPFKNTVVAELANDWIGYLPNLEAHQLGGYQTWMGLHSYAEPGTGERMADAAVEHARGIGRPVSTMRMARATACDALHADAAAAVAVIAIGLLSNSVQSAAADEPRTTPLSPEEELATFQLADSRLIVELVASRAAPRQPRGDQLGRARAGCSSPR